MPRGGAPGDVTVLEVGQEDLGDGEFDAHGMNPTSVLASLGALGGRLPRTFVVGCEPGDVSEGIGMTPAVAGAIDRALAAVRKLVDEELRDLPGERRHQEQLHQEQQPTRERSVT
jgi:hydrogenase maturation protease